MTKDKLLKCSTSLFLHLHNEDDNIHFMGLLDKWAYFCEALSIDLSYSKWYVAVSSCCVTTPPQQLSSSYKKHVLLLMNLHVSFLGFFRGLNRTKDMSSVSKGPMI